MFFCNLLLLIGLISISPALWGIPAQVIIVRHGEKPTPEGDHLNTQGRERAYALAPYALETPPLTDFGPPAVVFGFKPGSGDGSMRGIETAVILAATLQMPLHSPFDSTQFQEMAQEVLNNSEYDGKTVFICWEHNHIPDLAIALGFPNPPTYPGTRFDLTYIIRYVSPALPTPPYLPAQPYNTAGTAVYLQELLFGDLTTGP